MPETYKSGSGYKISTWDKGLSQCGLGSCFWAALWGFFFQSIALFVRLFVGVNLFFFKNFNSYL